MSDVALLPDKRGHLARLVRDLVCCGWKIDGAPADGRIPRNGIKIILKSDSKDIKLRVFAYKVTSSGRSRPQERRVEITTTYQSGLTPQKGFADVVLGVDVQSGKYVGIDSRRLRMGGETHNASSFFDLEGLSVGPGELLINPRPATKSIFQDGIELHAFFDRSRLSEYLFNQHEIHSGLYAYGGLFNGATPIKAVALPPTIETTKASGDSFVLVSNVKTHRKPIPRKLIEAVEARDFAGPIGRKITPEQLKQIQSICDEIGALGEQAVLTVERNRLLKLGFKAQANKVERVSLRSIGEGYDITSFEDDGVTPRYLEVKSTVGTSLIVDVSQGEWRAAKKHKDRYYLVRVVRVRTSHDIFFVRDPASLDGQGQITKTAAGWKIDLRTVLAA